MQEILMRQHGEWCSFTVIITSCNHSRGEGRDNSVSRVTRLRAVQLEVDSRQHFIFFSPRHRV